MFGLQNVGIRGEAILLIPEKLLIAFCLASPFVTTILGWIAVSQIRRSSGKLHGLWLAVFDGLLLPLLTLDFVIWFVCNVSLHQLRRGSSEPATRALVAIPALGVAVSITILLDVIIVWLVWRAVNKSSAGTAPAKPPSVPLNGTRVTSVRLFRPAILIGVLVFAICTAIALVWANILPETYAATARVTIEQVVPSGPTSKSFVDQNLSVTSYDPYAIQTQLEIIQSENVLANVVSNLNLNAAWGKKYSNGQALRYTETLELLKARISLQPVRNTSLIAITCYSESAVECAALANAVAKAYRDYSNDLITHHAGSPDQKNASQASTFVETKLYQVSIIDTAQAPRWPARPNKPLIVVTGIILGLFLSGATFGLRLIWSYFRGRTIRSAAGEKSKPDHFWRWFAVAVFAMIAIPFLVSIVGLLAAIAIPNFVKARAQAQENARQAAQLSSGAATDYSIGQTNFPFGDSIEITSVVRSENRLMVKGHYHLVSHDQALLALYMTTRSTNAVPTDSRQTMQISKGSGDFELVHTHLVPGLPHVSMYADGHPFAGIYFGNKDEVAEESKLELGDYQTNQITGGASQLTQEGWQLWQAHKLGEAAATFQQAVQLAPDDANAWNGLGWATFNSGKADEAEKAFQKVLSLEPHHPAALNGLGQIYLSQGKYDDAEKFLLQAAPQAPAAWFGLARLYLLEGKFEQAEKWAQNIVDSGQADETAKKMLEAAKAKKLSEGLRLMIEPSAGEPADLREARARLAELRVDYAEQNPTVQKALARVNELERLTKAEPDMPADLREAKAHLAELRIDYSEQNLLVQEALARIKVLEGNNMLSTAEDDSLLTEQPPVVVETVPVSGARDVVPGETEIRVRFSKPMADGSWSWSTAWENSTPEFIGTPHYEADGRTCVVKVKLAPGRTYAFWLNSERFHNFRDRAGQPAVPYLLIFQTEQN